MHQNTLFEENNFRLFSADGADPICSGATYENSTAASITHKNTILRKAINL